MKIKGREIRKVVGKDVHVEYIFNRIDIDIN